MPRRRIKLESETWTAIYSNVLTKQQQAAIPGIVAAAQQAREERVAAWKAAHPQARGAARRVSGAAPTRSALDCAPMPSFLSRSMTLSRPTRWAVPTMTR